MFKRHGGVCANFKNLPMILTKLCQISQCAVWGMGELQKKLECTKGSNIFVGNTLSEDNSICMWYKKDDVVFRTDRVKVCRIEYRLGLRLAMESGISTAKKLLYSDELRK